MNFGSNREGPYSSERKLFAEYEMHNQHQLALKEIATRDLFWLFFAKLHLNTLWAFGAVELLEPRKFLTSCDEIDGNR